MSGVGVGAVTATETAVTGIPDHQMILGKPGPTGAMTSLGLGGKAIRAMAEATLAGPGTMTGAMTTLTTPGAGSVTTGTRTSAKAGAPAMVILTAGSSGRQTKVGMSEREAPQWTSRNRDSERDWSPAQGNQDTNNANGGKDVKGKGGKYESSSYEDVALSPESPLPGPPRSPASPDYSRSSGDRRSRSRSYAAKSASRSRSNPRGPGRDPEPVPHTASGRRSNEEQSRDDDDDGVWHWPYEPWRNHSGNKGDSWKCKENFQGWKHTNLGARWDRRSARAKAKRIDRGKARREAYQQNMVPPPPAPTPSPTPSWSVSPTSPADGVPEATQAAEAAAPEQNKPPVKEELAMTADGDIKKEAPAPPPGLAQEIAKPAEGLSHPADVPPPPKEEVEAPARSGVDGSTVAAPAAHSAGTEALPDKQATEAQAQTVEREAEEPAVKAEPEESNEPAAVETPRPTVTAKMEDLAEPGPALSVAENPAMEETGKHPPGAAEEPSRETLPSEADRPATGEASEASAQAEASSGPTVAPGEVLDFEERAAPPEKNRKRKRRHNDPEKKTSHREKGPSEKSRRRRRRKRQEDLAPPPPEATPEESGQRRP